jgi:hypothetical protein
MEDMDWTPNAWIVAVQRRERGLGGLVDVSDPSLHGARGLRDFSR